MLSTPTRPEDENQPIERELLLRAILLKYGYDFTQYAETTMQRRVDYVVRELHMRSALDLLEKVLHSRKVFDEVLPKLTIGVTEMFRDPMFFRSLRTHVVPVLKTFPRVTIWCAGCSSGEEVYSLAILLKEEGLLDRATIFATDINSRALRAAREGIYSAEVMKTNTRNYQESGGRNVFNDYYTADYGFVKMDSSLLQSVVFSEHNLATDGVFAECQLILCRNVLIYFNETLQNRVVDLFTKSLHARGFLGVGSRESLATSSSADLFEAVDPKWKLYQRARALRRAHA